jgi:hypothetical protein
MSFSSGRILGRFSIDYPTSTPDSSAEKEAEMTLIDDAIRAGEIPESRRAHYETLYARDPRGTAKLLASLEPVPSLGRLTTVPAPTRGPIASAAGLAVKPHPMGGYVAERS